MMKYANKEIKLSTITIPTPIKQFNSRDNYIVMNDGEVYSPYEVWYEHWSDEALGRLTEEMILNTLNAEFCGELETGFVFESEIEAQLFVSAMKKLVEDK
ncbi:hypothetical protein [Mannheimia haemolytica]|nr:hypothetical protein [Mannheimia haemolytica]MDW0618355.1 hypothetical protein [Mannheimia haemolytica]